MMVKNNYWAGKIGERTGEFVTHPCLGQCSSRGDAGQAGYWAFNVKEPNKHCIQSRSGVLCRSCEEEYTETPSGMVHASAVYTRLTTSHDGVCFAMMYIGVSAMPVWMAVGLGHVYPIRCFTGCCVGRNQYAHRSAGKSVL